MYNDLLNSLERGKVRAAERTANNEWVINTQIKQKILDLCRNAKTVSFPGGFCDKEPLVPRVFNEKDQIRVVPGGTSVRSGVFIGKNVVIMPPSFVNIGAYIDDDSMVDSHVLVGSCAQIGKRVHLSAAVQIGGVLEPVGNRPVIIEDDCFIGAGVIIVEGIIIKEKAVIAPGVILSASVPIYDLVNERVFKGEIPQNAVVVPGTRPIEKSKWAQEQSLNLGCAIIIKYRDKNTDTSLELENALRY